MIILYDIGKIRTLYLFRIVIIKIIYNSYFRFEFVSELSDHQYVTGFDHQYMTEFEPYTCL